MNLLGQNIHFLPLNRYYKNAIQQSCILKGGFLLYIVQEQQ